jgi:hypothetical protein
LLDEPLLPLLALLLGLCQVNCKRAAGSIHSTAA